MPRQLHKNLQRNSEDRRTNISGAIFGTASSGYSSMRTFYVSKNVEHTTCIFQLAYEREFIPLNNRKKQASTAFRDGLLIGGGIALLIGAGAIGIAAAAAAVGPVEGGAMILGLFRAFR